MDTIRHLFLLVSVTFLGSAYGMEMPQRPSDKAGQNSRTDRQLIMPEFDETVLPEHRDILLAAARGDTAFLEQTLRDPRFDYRGFEIAHNGRAHYCRDSRGRDPFLFAVLNHHFATVQLLFSHRFRSGIDIDETLCAALRVTDERIVRFFADHLAQEGADEAYKNLIAALIVDSEEQIHVALNSINFDDMQQNTDMHYPPLHAAVLLRSLNGIRQILAHGCPIDMTNYDGETALCYGVRLGNSLCVQELLSAGANINAIVPDEDEPLLFYTITIERPEMLEILLERANVNENINGYTLLHHSAFQGNPECVAILLRRGAHVNARTQTGQTPLHCVFSENFWDRSTDVVRLLLQHGADVNARGVTEDGHQKTALNLEIDFFGRNETNSDIIKELLLWGAVIRGPDLVALRQIFIQEPLLAAVCSDTGNLLRFAREASQNVLNEALNFAIARQRGVALEVLIASGADVRRGLQFLETILGRILSPEARGNYERIRDRLRRTSLVQLIIQRDTIHDSLLQNPFLTRLPRELRERVLSSILFTGVQSNNVERTRRALQVGANPELVRPFIQDVSVFNPQIVGLVNEKIVLRQKLLQALKTGDVTQMQEALQAGARTDDSECKPLFLHAAEFPNADRAFEMIRVLLAHVSPAEVLHYLGSLQNRPKIAAYIIDQARQRGIAIVEPAWLIAWRMQQGSRNMFDGKFQ